MTLYRPNGNFGPVCDPHEEITDDSLPILFDASVLANPNAVTVDQLGQSGAESTCTDPGDYRPRGSMGPVCDPVPVGSDGLPCADADGNLPGGIGDTDPRVVNPFVPESDGAPVYTGPTEPYRPDGDFGPVCDPFVPFNINPENVIFPDEDDDTDDDERPEELDLVNPQPAPPVRTVAPVVPDYYPNGPFGPICDPFNLPPDSGDEEIIQPDFDPDTVYPDSGDFPNGIDYVVDPDGAITIGLPTTDAFEDGIDVPSVAGLAFKYIPFFDTSDVNQIPSSFTFDDSEPDKGDWDWSLYYNNGKFFELGETEVRDGKTGQELYEGLIDLVKQDPDREGDSEAFNPDTYCSEPWPDYVLDPYTDTDGNTVYRQVKSSPRTFQVQHETFCAEFAQKSAWISQGVCSFEGNTRLQNNAANFTTPITIPDTDTYTIRYKFIKRGELFLDYYDSPVNSGTPNTITLINATEGAGTYNAPPGMILDFDTRSSAYFNDPNGTICSDGCGDINGSGTWSTGNIGYRLATYEDEWDNNRGFTVEQDLIYASNSPGSKNGTGARIRVRFSELIVTGDSDTYTKVNVKSLLLGGEGYEVGEILTIPTWNNEFERTTGGAAADRLIRVSSVAPANSADPCAFGSKSMEIEAGEYFITAFVENYTIGSYKPHWKDSPAACAIEIFQGDFSEQRGQIPCDVGIQESTTPGTATFAANGDLVVTGTCTIKFDFKYDDNPNTFGTALGTVAYNELNVSFTQVTTQSTGNGSATRTATAGTYNIQLTSANSAGFTRENGNTKLCFKDSDGTDCNAELRITVLESTAAGEGITFTCGTEADVKLELRYDDDPTTQGLCLSSATWTGSDITLVRDTNKESGSRSVRKDVLSGTYPFSISDNAGGFNVVNPGSTTNNSYIVLYDGGGSDENGRITCELKGATGPNVNASFDSNGNLVVTGSNGYTNSHIRGLNDDSNVWSQSDVGTEITFTATDPAKGMEVQIGIVPRNDNSNGFRIVTDWAVRAINNYGSGYSVDDTFNVSYTHTSGGTVNAKVKIFSTRRGNFTVGNLIWSTTNNAVGFNESFTPFDD